MTRVKICGLTRIQDVEAALELGADAVGFVLEPTSPRCVKDNTPLMSSLARLGPYVTRVAVFGPMPDSFSPEGFQAVQAIDVRSVPRLVQSIAVVRVGTDFSEDVEPVAADAILLDSHSPGAYGGTGILVDLDAAASYVAGSRVPVILAGGLTPENVAGAIEWVRPYAVDVSSGVEVSPGIKDHAKLRDFIQAAKGA